LADFKKVSIPDVNIDSLKAKLEFLYSHRTLGLYDEAERKSGMELLGEYWKHKNSTNREEAQRFFDNLDEVLWRTLKPEVKAVLLEDMMVNASASTEHFLFRRDNRLKAMKNSYEKNVSREDGSVSQRFFATNTIFNGGNIANEHLFGLEDYDLIRNYIFNATFEKYGFSNIGDGTFGGEIDGIRSKYIDVTRNKNLSEMISLIYAAQNMEACIEMSKQSRLFTKEAVINNVRGSIGNRNKMIIAQNPRYVLARINLIEYITSHPEEYNDTLLQFPSEEAYMNVLMLSESQLYNKDFGGLRPEIERSYKLVEYSDPRKPEIKPLPFNLVRDYVVRYLKKDFKEKVEASRELKRLFINYAFGNFSEKERNILTKYYIGAAEYYQNLEEEIVDPNNFSVFEVDIEPSESTSSGSSENHHDGVKRPRKKIKPFEITEEDKEFINSAVDKDLRWTGKVLSTGVGTKAEDKNKLYYFVFSTGGYYILEPLNQGNNATVIVKADTDIDNLAGRLSAKNMSLDSLAESGEAIRIYHQREANGEYKRIPNRLKLVAQVISKTEKSISELRRQELLRLSDVKDLLSREELSKLAISKVQVEEVPKISEYIGQIQSLPMTSGISGNTLRRLRAEIIKKEKEELEEK